MDQNPLGSLRKWSNHGKQGRHKVYFLNLTMLIMAMLNMETHALECLTFWPSPGEAGQSFNFQPFLALSSEYTADPTVSIDKIEIRFPLGYGIEDANAVGDISPCTQLVYTTGAPICTGILDTTAFIIEVTGFQQVDNAGDKLTTYFFNILLEQPQFATTIEANLVQCRAYATFNGVQEFEAFTFSQAFVISPYYGVDALTITSNVDQNGAESEVTFTYTHGNVLPAYSWFIVALPKQNIHYDGGAYGNPSATSMVQDVNALSGSWTSTDGGSGTPASFSLAIGSGFNNDILSIELGNTDTYVEGSEMTLSVSPLLLPPNFKPVEGFQAQIGQNPYDASEAVTGGSSGTTVFSDGASEVIEDLVSLETATPGLITSANAEISNDSIGAEKVTFTFEATMINPIPRGAFIYITVDSTSSSNELSSLGDLMPSDPANDFSMVCTSGCDSSSISISYDSGTDTVIISNAFQNYVVAGQVLAFSATGFSNPSLAMTFSLQMNTVFTDGGIDYDIDQITGFDIQIAEGECQVLLVNVTDGDYRIWAEPENYTFSMTCNHDLLTTYSIIIVVPAQHTIVDRARCILGGQKTRYGCEVYDGVIPTVTAQTNVAGYIEIYDFTSTQITKGNEITFNVDSIRNPMVAGYTDIWEIYTVDASGSAVDKGTWYMDDDAWGPGNITTFEVEALAEGVGEYPVEYRFHIVPYGEICQYCYFAIEIPPEIAIIDENSLEYRCGTDLQDFVEEEITCTMSTDGRILYIENGFETSRTTNLTDSDYKDDPPDIYFTIDHFRNPREPIPTTPWNVTIYNQTDDVQYVWNETSMSRPTTLISGTAVPGYFQLTRDSEQNGAIANYDFTVKTTNFIQTGDQIYISLPQEASFSEDSTCAGRSNNLENYLECSISVDLSRALIKVKLSQYATQNLRRRRYLQTGVIDSGDAFSFRITNVRNPFSFRPTESLIYEVYTADNVLFEELLSGVEIINTVPGELSEFKNGLVPDSFESDVLTNYTVEILPVSYEQNMNIIIKLPGGDSETEMIQLPSEADGVRCFGLAGTDVVNQDDNELKCTVDYEAKTINITDAVTYQKGNPGAIRFQISQLRNPVENIITKSFTIQTETSDGYMLEEISKNVTINFYCMFPCASCEQDLPEQCGSCYSSAAERFFYEFSCYEICPDGFVNTTTNNCTACESPCATCTETPNMCLSCVEDYKLVEGEFYCREIVLWPFPFLCFAVISFIVITISEIVTKGESRFKESFIAFLAIPEFLAWLLCLIFMWNRVGSAGSTSFVAIALMLYIMINVAHAIIHPRQMHPNSLATYKNLNVNYPLGTCISRFVSYIVSFKFSLILVSWFCLSPRFKGDYSAMNWKQFNRFSIAFILLPYPMMMLGCCWFLYYNGFFSYAGFVAVEVILLSSIMAMLMGLDALSAIKCKTVGKAKTKKVFKVATGADYESDDDVVTKQTVRKVNQRERSQNRRGPISDDYGDEFQDDDSSSMGHDDSKKNILKTKTVEQDELERMSRMSNETGALRNEEAQKQIQMLEELAKQMRIEKQQLDRDRQELEQQRLALQNQREQQEYRLDNYMEEHQRQTSALSHQVRELEKQKHDLVRSVEEKLTVGAAQTENLVRQITEAQNTAKLQKENQVQRRNFRDFEGEMEDYEAVAEVNSDDEGDSDDEAPCVDTFVDRMQGKPSYGEIDYYRQMNGEDQHWMQQMTPRAGGDSMLGQHDIDATTQLAMDRNLTAQYDDNVSVPPTANDSQLEVGQADAVHHEDSEKLEGNDSEMYQNRSDAEMEVNSHVDHKEAVEQQFFEAERAVFSQLQDKMSNHTSQEVFDQILQPAFDQVSNYPDMHATEQQFFKPLEQIEKGEADKISELRSSVQQFFNAIEKPTFEDVHKDNENEMEKVATQQKFFNNENPMKGEAEDLQRQGVATPIEDFNKSNAAFSQVPDVEEKSNYSQRLFNQENPIRDNVSDINRDKLASEQRFHEREHAMNSIGDDHSRGRTGSQQQFFQNEDGKYSQERSAVDKSGYGQEFFKNDEAIRADISSQDRSQMTQQNYFKNVESQEFGKPDDFSRQQHETAQQFVDKRDMDNLPQRNAAGAATPHTAKDASAIDYMDRSEADFGKQSSIPDQATAQDFFEPNDKPEFGRAGDYVRQAQDTQEYDPPESEDVSGNSVSSEGSIANHKIFNAGQDFTSAPDPGKQKRSESPHFQDKDADVQAQQIKKRRIVKQILYSDKSETSVEELMDDTPSNYNIQNGRFEGKSLGLKGLLLHAKDNTSNTLGNAVKPFLGGDRSPRATSDKTGQLQTSGMIAAQRGIIGSQHDEKAFINNLYANQRMHNTIGEVSSGNEGSNIGGLRNTRSQVRTNKQFSEDPRGLVVQSQQKKPPMPAQSRSPNMASAQDRDRVQTLQKNNYFNK